MKRLLLIFGLLLCALPSHAAITHIQSAQGKCTNASFAGNIGANCAGSSITFSFTATNANDAVVFSVGCSSTTASVISLVATGWTITSLSAATGVSGSFIASFGAISPNTTAATFTISTTASNCGSFINDLVDEFAGIDTTGGTTTFSAHASDTGSATNCAATPGTSNLITTVNANEAVWGACNDSVTLQGSGYTKGADDTVMDWSEYKITTDGAGTGESVTWTGSTGRYTLVMVTIKPSGGVVATSPTRTLTGVGK